MKKKMIEYIGITIGTIIVALSLDLFLEPNRIAPGGVSGLAIVISYLTGWPVGAITLAINIPLFLLALRILGAHFSAKTLYATFLLGISIDALSFIRPITNDAVLAAVYGGIIMGIGLGMVIKYGATTGGTDLAAAIVRKYYSSLSIGWILLIIDFMIIAFAGFVFNAELALYALATDFIVIKVIDFIQEGTDYERMAIIISDYSEKISNEIIEKLERGVTALKGKGVYTGKEKEILLCVIQRSEVSKLMEIIKSVDKQAFVILSNTHEVLGEGFKDIM